MAGLVRWTSGLERLWLAAAAHTPPFCFACVVEGFGTVDLDRLRAAVREVVAVSPGFTIRLAGALGWTRWVPGPPPVVRQIDGWTGGPAAWLEVPLDPWTGPTVEVSWCPGTPSRLVVRVLHAVSDGRGVLGFVRDLTRALCGRAPLGSAGGPATDHDVARRFTAPRPSPDAAWGSPTGAPEGDEPGVVWSRVTVRGAFDRPLARLVVALARAAPDPIALDVPVDLRRMAGLEAASANLSGWVRVDASEFLAAEDPVGSAAASIRVRAATSEVFGPVRAAHALRWVPMSWLVREGLRRSAEERAARRWPVSGTVSWIGRVDAGEVSWPGFVAARVWWVPPGSAGLPLLSILCGVGSVLDLTASAPRPLATGGRLPALLLTLGASLGASATVAEGCDPP